MTGITSMGGFINHRFKLSEDFSISAGTRIYHQAQSVNFNSYLPTDGGDPLLTPNPVSKITGTFADFGFNIKYKFVYAGATAINVFDHTMQFTSYSESTFKRTFNIVAGANVPLTNWLDLNASVFVPETADFSTLDVNANFTINKRFIAGLSYRTIDDNVRVNAGLDLNDRFRILLLVYNPEHRYDDFRGETLLSYRF